MVLPKLWLCLPPSGIEPQGNTVLQPAHFTVQTVDAGVGEVLVYIEDPEGHTEEVWGGHWGSDKSTDQQRNGLEMAAGATFQCWRRGRPHHGSCRKRGVRRSSDGQSFPFP